MATAKLKSEKMKVELSVTVPSGTSKTKVEKALSTALKGVNFGVEGLKLGAPKVVPAPEVPVVETA